MMSYFSRALMALLFLTSLRTHAADKDAFALTFSNLPLQQLVMMFYDRCEKRGLVFDPAVNKIEDAVTIKTPSMSCAQMKALVIDTMGRSGVGIDVRSGYDVVRLVRVKDERDDFKELIYRPRFRDAADLAEMVMIAVRKGSFAHQRRGAQVQVQAGIGGSSPVPETGSNGASLTAKGIDKLVFLGPVEEVNGVRGLLLRLDVPTPQVEISVGIYEFQSGNGVGSAISAAVSLFKSKLNLSITGAISGGSTLKLNLPSIDAALSLLDEDTRFRYVARPRVLAKDGEQVSFTSGQDVRVPGSVSVDRNGNQVQSIVTMNAGVMLQATPVIRADVVDLSLHQVISDFVSSPNDEPSVVKRDLMNRLVLLPGYVYMVGGLQTTRKTQSKKRLFGFSVGDSFQSTDTEIIILLSVKPDR